jgi:hypothetical protein
MAVSESGFSAAKLPSGKSAPSKPRAPRNWIVRWAILKAKPNRFKRSWRTPASFGGPPGLSLWSRSSVVFITVVTTIVDGDLSSKRSTALPHYVRAKSALDEPIAVIGLGASNLCANFSRVHSLDHPHDWRDAVSYETVSNDEAELAVRGTCDARTVFGDKFSKGREVKSLGRQELTYDFLIF